MAKVRYEQEVRYVYWLFYHMVLLSRLNDTVGFECASIIKLVDCCR